MALTDAWLKANKGKPIPKRIEKADRDGLSVRVTPKGKIVFQLRYRHAGKQQRVDLGDYPSTSLKKARIEADRLRHSLTSGHDPRTVLRVEKLAVVTAKTLSDVFYEWYESYCIKAKKDYIGIKRSFEIHVLPRLGNIPLEALELHHWFDLMESMAGRLPGITERILVNTKQLYKWAVKHQIVKTNPLIEIGTPDLHIKKRADKRTLSDDEIRLVLEAINYSRIVPKNKLFMKLCLFFACRNGEIRQAEVSHFNMETCVWTVPASNHKTGETTGDDILRPIIPEVIPMLEQVIELSTNSKYMFTNNTDNNVMGFTAPLSLPGNVLQWVRKNKGVNMEHWSMHSLRKTARTNFSTMTDPHIAEIMLGHSLSGYWKTYDRHEYLEEQADAYKKWWDKLTGLGRM